jgi:hypothetical protein
VSDSELFNEFGSLVDIIAHKRAMGSYSIPSASRSAPSCLHMFLSAG